jgi:hypothetical protein
VAWSWVAAWPRMLWEDLSPFAGRPLPPLRPLRSARFGWLAWLPHVAVALYAVLVAAAAVSQGAAPYLGVALGLPLLLCLYRPMAGWWTSIGLGTLLSEAIRPETGGPVWGWFVRGQVTPEVRAD